MNGEKDEQRSTISESEYREVKPIFTELELTLIASIINSIVNPAELKWCQNAPGLVSEIFGMVLQKLKDSPDVERYISVMAYSHEDEIIYFITKMSQEKKVLLAKVIASEVPFDVIGGIKAQERFKRISKLCGLPWEIVNETLMKTYKKWYYAIRYYKKYCFETREEAEQAVNFLSSNNEIEEWRVFEGDNAYVHVRSFDEFKASIERERQHALAQWYAKPAFIAADPEVWLENMVKTKIRNQGLLSASTSDNPKSSQKTGCLVPLVLCMTGLFLSCAVIAIGVFVASNI